jgi:lysophospholipase L1-like esterase
LKDVFCGKTVLFQGDSVTDCGRSDREHGWGYARKVYEVYKSLLPSSTAKFVNRGVGGDRSAHLLNRYKADFLEPMPNFISILIGINDVWSCVGGSDGVATDVFERNYRALLEKIKTDMPGAAIMIIEPFLLHSLPDHPSWHNYLDPKIQATRKLAAEYADSYLPLDGILASYAITRYRPSDISEDGVHPTDLGHGLIAYEWLKAVGAL